MLKNVWLSEDIYKYIYPRQKSLFMSNFQERIERKKVLKDIGENG
jgi:hypothetical protein